LEGGFPGITSEVRFGKVETPRLLFSGLAPWVAAIIPVSIPKIRSRVATVRLGLPGCMTMLHGVRGGLTLHRYLLKVSDLSYSDLSEYRGKGAIFLHFSPFLKGQWDKII
jgi:hypothetical protein